MTTVDSTGPQLLRDTEVVIPADTVELAGHLRVPVSPIGLVVFAHGSGSTRNTPRSRSIAEVLVYHRLATMSIDLLTPAESTHPAWIFDIALLGDRLAAVRSWLRTARLCRTLPVGYFGAGSDAPAALWAAAERGDDVRAVVVRGARPDLAGERLADVTAPTLFLVGGHDTRVHALNRRAAAAMRCEHRVQELNVPGHVSEGPRVSEWAARLAAAWFTEYLAADPLASAAESGPDVAAKPLAEFAFGSALSRGTHE